MTSLLKRHWQRWILLFLIFGIGPLALYLIFIKPAREHIASFRDRTQQRANLVSTPQNEAVSASEEEMKQLDAIKFDQLQRFKKIASREALVQFNGSLADALATQARNYGLQVMDVDLHNALMKGKYVPLYDQALDKLSGLPGVAWEDLTDPIALPMLKLPFVEIQITVAGKYAQVFSFIESLPEFPSPVNLANLETTSGPDGRNYILKIHGYFFSSKPENQQAEQTMASR